jgi:methyltransferase (TIGR00027 family)
VPRVEEKPVEEESVEEESVEEESVEERVDCTGVRWGSVEWTMLCTLYLRAYDSRSAQPVLADSAAAAAVERIDYDFGRMERKFRPSSNRFLVALRAKQLDEWAADFLDRHPEAVVLHLGCGLDSRAYRLELPPGARWFDLDVPEVIALRRRVYAETERCRTIGASVTDPGWLEGIPTDRPVLVIAEGLLMYLAASDVRELLRRITDRFPGGELLFDGVSPLHTRLVRLFRWGLRDGRDVEGWNAGLTYVAGSSVLAQGPRVPVRSVRVLYRLGSVLPGLNGFERLYRFRF